jgi:uncharacterized protein YfiM (DUF2279 family)
VKWLVVATLLCCSTAHADEWLGRDKGEHSGLSLLLGAGGYVVGRMDRGSRLEGVLVGLGTVVVVGGAKELIDLTGWGDPSVKDFAADVAGGLVGVGISVGVDWLVTRHQPAR